MAVNLNDPYQKDIEKTIKDPRYNRLNTIKDIGIHLTERMINSWPATHENDDIAYNSPPMISFPGEEASPYDELLSEEGLKYRDEFYAGNESLLYMSGDPRVLPAVNYNSPGLAMGQAKVLNPDFQFNELDDVRSDYRRPYIGRLYSERIYDYNLPVVLFETGVMTLNLGLLGIASALASPSATHDMTSYLRDPNGGAGFKFVFQKMGAALRGILNFTVGGIISGKRFYKFNPNSRIYMRFVNEMLIEVAAWMDLARVPVLDKEYWDNKDRAGTTEEEAEEIEKELDKEENCQINYAQVGDFKVPASSGYRGLSQTLSVLNILPGWKTGNDGVQSGESGGLGNGIKDAVIETINMTAATSFIPFGLSAGIQVSEEFANDTMRHPLSEDLEEKGRQVYRQSQLGFLGKTNSIVEGVQQLFNGDYLGAAFTAGKEWLKSEASQGKIFGEAGLVMSGEGKFVLPDVWEKSEFRRTQQLNFKFYSPYGHRLAIFENTMVQSIFLINMAAPRQVGSSTYTSPFYIRAFSKGLFSIEAGLVESLTIKRSEEKNFRTVEGFSKMVTCELRIKDVLPTMMVSLDAGIFGIISAKNVGFREYIAMMANVDMYDRTAILNRYKVFVNALANKLSFDNILTELKYAASQTLPAKLINAARIKFYGYRPPSAVSSIKAQANYGM